MRNSRVVNWDTLPLFLSVEDLAMLLNMCRQTVVKSIERGEIPAHKFGSQYRVSKNELQKIFERKV